MLLRDRRENNKEDSEEEEDEDFLSERGKKNLEEKEDVLPRG